MIDKNLNDFLSLVQDRNFENEADMQKLLLTELPELLDVAPERAIPELKTTTFDGTLKNISDLVIVGAKNKNQVLVAFEFKLDKSVMKYSNGNFDNSKKQLHKYCQDLNSPYGILLSETHCHIFRYKYYSSYFNFEEVKILPPLSVIEEMLAEQKNERIRRKPILQSRGISNFLKYLLIGLLVIALSIATWYFWPLPLENCTKIKGNVSLNKDGTVADRIYHVPGSRYYDATKPKKSDGDKCFRTKIAASVWGFQKPMSD